MNIPMNSIKTVTSPSGMSGIDAEMLLSPKSRPRKWHLNEASVLLLWCPWFYAVVSFGLLLASGWRKTTRQHKLKLTNATAGPTMYMTIPFPSELKIWLTQFAYVCMFAISSVELVTYFAWHRKAKKQLMMVFSSIPLARSNSRNLFWSSSWSVQCIGLLTCLPQMIPYIFG